ncbi:MAG: cytochrome C [Betaproteobacteria bacterium]|nr:cytochrome C [Betaproteobacteria bacterium]
MKTALVLLFILMRTVAAAEPAPVPYPEGWRDWRHVKSMVILPGHGLYEGLGGVHHIYANKKAMEGYKSGTFLDGAVIVVDFFVEVAKDNTVTEGERKMIAIAHKNAKKWKDTGGWGWEAFAGVDKNKRAVGANAATACYQCH